MNQIVQIAEWQEDRGLDQMPYAHEKETLNIIEEVFETFGLTRDDADGVFELICDAQEVVGYTVAKEDMVDAYCDIIVYAVGAIMKLGYSPTLALDECIKEISDRTGRYDIEVGKWVKEPKKLNAYKANYTEIQL